VSGNDEAERKDRLVGAARAAVRIVRAQRRLAGRGKLAGKDRVRLSGTEGLNTMGYIGERLVQLPAQSIVESQVRRDFEAVLGKEVVRIRPYILRLRRA